MLRGKRKDPRGISQSTEHYLRAIRDLRKERGYARVSDVALQLRVSAPTVSNMIRHLTELKLVHRDRAKFLLLTPAGDRLAAGVVGRKQVMLTFLKDVLGLEPAIAERDACETEHAISGVMIDRLIDLIKFMNTPGQEGAKAKEAFVRFRRTCSVGGRSCSECEFQCESVMSGCDRLMNVRQGN
jgi:DtxR family transcriptional regulator, Mn-dependent transcriptional regulator